MPGFVAVHVYAAPESFVELYLQTQWLTHMNYKNKLNGMHNQKKQSNNAYF